MQHLGRASAERPDWCPGPLFTLSRTLVLLPDIDGPELRPLLPRPPPCTAAPLPGAAATPPLLPVDLSPLLFLCWRMSMICRKALPCVIRNPLKGALKT